MNDTKTKPGPVDLTTVREVKDCHWDWQLNPYLAAGWRLLAVAGCAESGSITYGLAWDDPEGDPVHPEVKRPNPLTDDVKF